MGRKFLQHVILFSIAICSSCGSAEFGYISYSTFNIGDDIQAYAAKRFLNGNLYPIDREYIADFIYDGMLPTLVNGWYMHTKGKNWIRSDLAAPKKSWPPSAAIDPLLISIHISNGFSSIAFSRESIQYFKDHGPVGARDLSTLKKLQARGIPSYFSGCLCLTLDNECTERNDVIYAVDIDEACYRYLASKTTVKVERMTHEINAEIAVDTQKRDRYMHDVLEKYMHAKAVVTTRLHSAMPCIAFQTPVLLIHDEKDQRFHGLSELLRHCNRHEFLHGQYDFNFDHPDPNPDDYLDLRENLIRTVTHWVEEKKRP